MPYVDVSLLVLFTFAFIIVTVATKNPCDILYFQFVFHRGFCARNTSNCSGNNNLLQTAQG